MSATDLGAALFGDALAHADSLHAAFEAAHARIAAGERRGQSPTAAGAQLIIGPDMAAKLKELDADARDAALEPVGLNRIRVASGAR